MIKFPEDEKSGKIGLHPTKLLGVVSNQVHQQL